MTSLRTGSALRFAIGVFAILACSANAFSADLLEQLSKSKRVLFLGDSITAGGQYVADVQAWMYTRGMMEPEVIDCGLASETVSGLSEDGHAGGKFPRPDLAERLDRVLKLTKPDLVFACYGINCGIYQPFDEARFAKYQEGYKALKEAVEKSGSKLIVITPPFYDDVRSPRKGFSYNDVLAKYSKWLVDQQANGWNVIDLHSAMTKEVEEQRKVTPKFHFQGDGVHPSGAGHWFMAQQIIKGLGDPSATTFDSPEKMIAAAGGDAEALKLIEQKVYMLRDAYVAAAGHKRPGIQAGLPVDKAEEKSAELKTKIAGAFAER